MIAGFSEAGLLLISNAVSNPSLGGQGKSSALKAPYVKLNPSTVDSSPGAKDSVSDVYTRSSWPHLFVAEMTGKIT